MKKVISIIALVVAMVMMMSVASFAADPTFMVAEDAVIPEGTTVTPAADSIAVETASVAGNYYGILLVEGDALPTVDNAILYIDQATAADVAQAFTVLPIIPEAGTELTLYISSNVAGAELIAIPMVYDAEAEEPTYTLGDVTGDTVIDLADAQAVINFFLKGTEFTVSEAGDVTGDGVVDLADAQAIINYFLKGTEF